MGLFSRKKQTPQPIQAPPKPAKTSVLICDDTPAVRNFLTAMLRDRGYETTAVENGEQAVAAYSNLRPDITLMDLVMPGMDGIETIRHIKGADPAAQILVVSAFGNKAMVVESIQAGAKDFVVKPANLEELPQRLLAKLPPAAKSKSVSSTQSGN